MKTAVEWFAERIQSDKIFNFETVLSKAKQMEKEKRKKDFVNGYKSRAKESNLIFDEISEKYAIYLFNETFKSE
jgi:hypothetical protein